MGLRLTGAEAIGLGGTETGTGELGVEEIDVGAIGLEGLGVGETGAFGSTRCPSRRISILGAKAYQVLRPPINN